MLFTKAAPFGTPSKTSGADEASTAAPNVKMAPLLQVAVGGVDDEMVWAIDSKHGLHCRKGVTTNLPIGTGWIRVSSKENLKTQLRSTDFLRLELRKLYPIPLFHFSLCSGDGIPRFEHLHFQRHRLGRDSKRPNPLPLRNH